MTSATFSHKTAPGTRHAVTITRRVEWADTDAAGHHHHSVILRWAEAAEAELLRRLGQEHLFGHAPRVRYEVDYRERLWFGQTAEIELAIAHLGEKSMRYEFTVRHGSSVAAAGSVVVAFAAPDAAHAVSWPDDVRAALEAL
ncbi:acyl-CoA thioesterase [Streptosporangium sp. KLBMP 9127]|nr:acyl-CoA thioesterase [Streptosporangium sp. KLBMP 9127]